MFELHQCMLTNNDCYKKATPITPKGIVVHSTGANNPYLERYVQPDDGYLGKNPYGNSWNRGGLSVCVHAFIGYDKYKNVKCYQTLPFNIACWGIGRGPRGSYNYNPTAYIQFEICEDNLKNEDYFTKAFDCAADFCAYLCTTYNLPIENVVSHHEGWERGYGSNHSDCDHWLKKFGKNMNWFRSLVLSKMGPQPTPPTPTPGDPNAYVTSGNGLVLHNAKNYNNSSAIGLMPYKAEVEWTATDGSFATVNYNGTQGYCSKNYLVKMNNAYVTSGDGLVLHNKKDFKDSSAICVMPSKTKVTWMSTSGNFAYVNYNGIWGYCSKNYLRKI